MKMIYFNHRGFEIAVEDNFNNLLQEMSDKIEFCRNYQLRLAFYKDIYSINLLSFDKNFIDYIYANNAYRDFCNLFIKYIDENLVYPQNKQTHLYDNQDNYLNWFIEMCNNDNVYRILSLSNDNLFDSEEYVIGSKTIQNIKTLDNLSECLNSEIIFQSIDDVFENIQLKFQDQIKILPDAKKSTRQLPTNNKTYNNIFKAIEGLVKIILPTNSNKLSQQIQSAFQVETSFQISPESRATLDNNKYAKYRIKKINGEDKLFSNHVKIGDNIRIYYYIFENTIYIGHCGLHLPTVKFSN